jgi:hypothetical protein
MTELVERYVHQVGRYLPPKERAEIEAELRSQIQDQLDDRYEGARSQAEVASVLAELGHPRQIAISYTSDQYLVGPALYPFMMMVLRYGWLLVPAIVIFLNLFGALVSPPQTSLFSLIVDTVLGVLQATLIFSAVVVLGFALIQHSHLKLDAKEEPFNPLDLPEVDDPHSVDRFEAASGIAIGTLVALVLLYFLRVGGLTPLFNLSDPGEVIPVPATWLVVMIVSAFGMIVLHLIVLRRNRWSAGMWLAQTLLELIGVVCLYFVLYEPVFERLVVSSPAFGSLPFVGSTGEVITVLSAILNLLGNGRQLVRLWSESGSSAPPYTVPTNR